MSKLSSALIRRLVLVGICAVVAVSVAVAQRPTPQMRKAGAPPAQANGRVTAARLAITPTGFSGACPARIDFHVRGTITTNGPGTVSYRFWSNTGGTTFPQGVEGTVSFSGAGTKTVTKEATLAAEHTISAGEFLFEAAMEGHTGPRIARPFRVNCRGGVAAGRQGLHPGMPGPSRVTGHVPGEAGGGGTQPTQAGAGGQGRAYANVSMSEVRPDIWRGACPHQFRFSAVIWSESPGDVHYTWVRSDGSQGQTETIHFPGNQKRKVYDTWTLGADKGGHYRGWERLKIDSPNRFTGPEIVFNLDCTK